MLQLNLRARQPGLLPTHLHQERPMGLHLRVSPQTGLDALLVEQFQGLGEELIGNRIDHVHSLVIVWI
jgi:hypothetical protein